MSLLQQKNDSMAAAKIPVGFKTRREYFVFLKQLYMYKTYEKGLAKGCGLKTACGVPYGFRSPKQYNSFIIQKFTYELSHNCLWPSGAKAARGKKRGRDGDQQQTQVICDEKRCDVPEKAIHFTSLPLVAPQNLHSPTRSHKEGDLEIRGDVPEKAIHSPTRSHKESDLEIDGAHGVADAKVEVLADHDGAASNVGDNDGGDDDDDGDIVPERWTFHVSGQRPTMSKRNSIVVTFPTTDEHLMMDKRCNYEKFNTSKESKVHRNLKVNTKDGMVVASLMHGDRIRRDRLGYDMYYVVGKYNADTNAIEDFVPQPKALAL